MYDLTISCLDMEVKEASWGKWSPWSHCKPPVNCRGHGTRTRHRFCLQDPQKPMLICRVSKGVSHLEMCMDFYLILLSGKWKMGQNFVAFSAYMNFNSLNVFWVVAIFFSVACQMGFSSTCSKGP